MKVICQLILLLSVITAISCKSSEKTRRDISSVQITIGQGGGFTGYYTDYIIYGSGKVERYTSKNDSTIQVENIPTDSIRAWVKKMDVINFYGIELDQPGNMNYYLELKEPGKRHRIRWGNAVPPAEVENLYNRIWEAVRD